jgi:hypothetical protein
MRRRGFFLILALAATAVALVAPTVATGARPYVVQGQTLFVTNIGDVCPGFAAYFPPGPDVGDPPGTFHLGYWGGWPAGEYLRFDTVTQNAGGIITATGSGGPVSEHTYRVIGRYIQTIDASTYGTMLIIRDDGATVSGEVAVKTDGNHGFLLTDFDPSTTACRLHR